MEHNTLFGFKKKKCPAVQPAFIWWSDRRLQSVMGGKEKIRLIAKMLPDGCVEGGKYYCGGAGAYFDRKIKGVVTKIF